MSGSSKRLKLNSTKEETTKLEHQLENQMKDHSVTEDLSSSLCAKTDNKNVTPNVLSDDEFYPIAFLGPSNSDAYVFGYFIIFLLIDTILNRHFSSIIATIEKVSPLFSTKTGSKMYRVVLSDENNKIDLIMWNDVEYGTFRRHLACFYF